MEKITVSVDALAPIELVFELFTQPSHIIKWNQASPDWCTSRAENDLRVGGTFLSRMEAVDGSEGFDFEGTYTSVEPGRSFSYVLSDKREVTVIFIEQAGMTKLTEVFDPESEHPIEMQQFGWQSILNSFKSHTEKVARLSTLDDFLPLIVSSFEDNKAESESSDGDAGSDGGGGDGGGGD